MDANQTRFHLALGDDWLDARDWVEGRLGPARRVPKTPDDPSDVLYEGGRLTLNRSVTLIGARPGDTPASRDLHRGAVRDRLGNVYVVEGAGIRLRLCSQFTPGPGDWLWLDPAGEPLRGLCITADDLLAAGRPATGEILLFDLLAGGAPVAVPGSIGLHPYDLATSGSDVVILDRDAGRVHTLHLALPPAPAPALPTVEVPPAPVPPAGFGPCLTPRDGLEASVDAGFPLPAGIDAVAVDVLPGGDVVVLDGREGAGILRFRGGVEIPGEAFAAMQLDPPRPIAGHDLVVCDGVLYVVDAQGNQAFSWAIGESLDHRAELLPLRLYLGRDLVAGDGSAWYETGGRWVPLVALERPRPRERGLVILPVYGAPGAEEHGWDGGLPGCVWHRLLLDGCFPPGTTVRVATRATDDRALLADPDWGWRAEPPLYTRADGSELPFDHREVTTLEVLLQAAVGRWLQVRLELVSDGSAAPTIEALRVYHPRFSYLEHYLPAVWREDAASAAFVERFLGNPEGVFTTIEDRVAGAHRLLDPAHVDPEYLPWLASWFDATLDPAWGEAKRRFFVANAMTFFRARGTRRGVLAAVRMLLHDCPSLALFGELADGIHLVEQYTRRPRVGLQPADLANARWVPADDAAALHARWETATGRTGGFPVSRPTDPAAALEWESFCATHLGFSPGATSADAARFAAYVRRKRGSALSTAWPSLPSPPSGPLFTALPTAPAALEDWFQFESLVRPIGDHAHRFTLVLPMPAHDDVAADPGLPERRRAAVRRVVEVEKPAHTVFDVIYADLLFRPGEVRVGVDTVLGDALPGGAPPFRLDQKALAEAELAAPYPGPTAPPGAPFPTALPLAPEPS